MSWLELLNVLRRRWYACLPCILVTGVLLVGVVAKIAPTYTTTASVMLLPAPQSPSVTTANSRTNPYANLPLTALASVLAQALDGSAVAKELQDKGYKGDYLATPRVDGSAVVDLQAKDPSASAATRRLDKLVEIASQQLDGWQSDTPSGAKISLRTLIPPDDPVPSYGSRTRALIVATALGSGLTVGVCLLVDVQMLRRRRAKSTAQPPSRARLKARA